MAEIVNVDGHNEYIMTDDEAAEFLADINTLGEGEVGPAEEVTFEQIIAELDAADANEAA